MSYMICLWSLLKFISRSQIGQPTKEFCFQICGFLFDMPASRNLSFLFALTRVVAFVFRGIILG